MLHRGEDNSSVLELNQQLDLIKVIGQDELVVPLSSSHLFPTCQDVGRTDPEADWWEEERAVAQILLHPNCDSGQKCLPVPTMTLSSPATAPQFCVLVLVLTEGLSMQKPGRPRAACLNCMVSQQDDRSSRLTPGGLLHFQSAEGTPLCGGLRTPGRAVTVGLTRLPWLPLCRERLSHPSLAPTSCPRPSR